MQLKLLSFLIGLSGTLSFAEFKEQLVDTCRYLNTNTSAPSGLSFHLAIRRMNSNKADYMADRKQQVHGNQRLMQ